MPYWSVYFFSPLSFSTLLKTRYHNSHAKMGTLERVGLSALTNTMKAYNILNWFMFTYIILP